MEFQTLYNKLLNAYETSTPSCNRFSKAVYSIKWDEVFKADDEYYFMKNGNVLITPSLYPFEMPWKPSIMPSDGSGTITF